ncbi:hypothetical protein EMIT047CA2_20048 [Pseudomonas soli]
MVAFSRYHLDPIAGQARFHDDQYLISRKTLPNLKQSASKLISLGITLRTLPTRLNCRGSSAGLTSPGRLSGDQV